MSMSRLLIFTDPSAASILRPESMIHTSSPFFLRTRYSVSYDDPCAKQRRTSASAWSRSGGYTMPEAVPPLMAMNSSVV